MNKLFTYISLALILSVTLFSCAPSIEGETEDWERNKQKVSELTRDYPNYATLINEQFALATTAMDNALKVQDEEQKAEAMEAANDLISASFVGKLGAISYKIESIADKQDKLGSMRMKTTVVKKAETALERSFKAIRIAESSLKANPANIAEAEELIGEATSELISAESRLSSAIRSAKKSMEKKKNTKKKSEKAAVN